MNVISVYLLVGWWNFRCVHNAGLLGVITRLRNPLELRFVIHQNPGLICIWLSMVSVKGPEAKLGTRDYKL